MESAPNQSRIVHNHPAKPFPKGNKLGKGGKRPGAGRKKKSVIEAELERQQTAREIYRAEQQRQARAVIDTYYRLAKSGRYPTATLHEIDKIDPDEQVTAPTLVINFVSFNPGSLTSSSPIDVTSSSVQPPSPAPIVSPHQTATVAPRLTFTDIVEKE